MTIREYLEANQESIFRMGRFAARGGYLNISLSINNLGELHWLHHLTNNYRSAGIYKNIIGDHSYLSFTSIPMSFFTNVDEGGEATAEDLIDELYYENWTHVQTFSSTVETIQHFYDLIVDLPHLQEI